MFKCKECTEFCKNGEVNCPFYKGIYDTMALCDIEKRAKEGDFPAKLYLAVCKVEGHRMEKHPVKGAWELERLSKSKEYRYSTDHENYLAEGFLAFCYFEGKGVFKNEKKAFHICDNSAFYTGCHILDRKTSERYEKGIGTIQSDELSHLYLTKAAMHGDVSLMMKVGDEILNYIGDSEFSTYTMDKLTISDAFFLYKTAEKNGISEGRLRIEENFYRCAPALIGYDTYKKAESGDVSAQVKVGDFYISNEYHKDMREAHKWYLKAAENKNTYACFNLGCIYGCGSDNIPKDLGKAYFCYQKASEDSKWNEFSVKELKKIESVELAHLGKDEGFFKTPAEKIRLAMYYMEGKAVKKDLNKSSCLLAEAEPKIETAIEKEFLNLAFEKAGDFYLENPTEENVKNAAKCYRKVGNNEKLNKCFSINWEASLPQNMQETLEKAQKGDADSQFLIGLSMLSCEEFPRNTKDAEKWLLASADQGNKLACHILGLDYYYGYSFKQDYTLAVKFLEKAPDIEEIGEKGERSYLLGLCYYKGLGISEDKAKAVQLFLKSAEAGNKYAQGWLGFCLHKGIGCDKNYDESRKWTSLAASNGVNFAIRNMGHNYEYGFGIKQDFFEAVKFYQKALEAGFKTASDDLVRIGKSIYYKATTHTDKNSRDFSRLLTLSAEAGNAEAQRTLGKLMREGVKLPKQAAEGERWLCAAAEQGDYEACHILGLGYYHGKGFEKNYEKAVEFLKEIVNTDTDGTISDILATCYYNGYGTTKDMEKAAQFYHKAAEKGIFNSQVMWANCCFEGEGTSKDYAEALRWYHLTSKKDHVESIRNMGFLYEKGLGVEQDTEEAIRLYKKTQSLGYDKASKDLKRIGEEFYKAGLEKIPFGPFGFIGISINPLDLDISGSPSLPRLFETRERLNQLSNYFDSFKEAVILFKRAAELGYEKANYSIGYCYYFGLGVEQNEDDAIKWFEKGASLGHRPSQNCLYAINEHRKAEEKRKAEELRLAEINRANEALAQAIRNSHTNVPIYPNNEHDENEWNKLHDELDEIDKIVRLVNTPGYDPESYSSIPDYESYSSIPDYESFGSIPDYESFPPSDSIW